MNKLLSTLRISLTLILARTFGDYECSVWDGKFSYARYKWRGKIWAFPTSSIDEEEEEKKTPEWINKRLAL